MCQYNAVICKFCLSFRKRVKFLDEINEPEEKVLDSSTMLTELKSEDTSTASEELQGIVIIMIYSVI